MQLRGPAPSAGASQEQLCLIERTLSLPTSNMHSRKK
jgi:hypothetical protein